MIAWDILNSLLRLATTVILIWKLTNFHVLLNAWERNGMALGAAGSIMTIPVIFQSDQSSYSGWSTTVFGIGIFMYFFGRYLRLRNHDRNNRAAIEQARNWFL